MYQVHLPKMREELPAPAPHAAPLQVRVWQPAEVPVPLLSDEEQAIEQRLQAHTREAPWLEGRSRCSSIRAVGSPVNPATNYPLIILRIIPSLLLY